MVVNCVFIRSSQNQPKLVKMIGHFRDWSVGQNGFPVGHVRCPALISTTEHDMVKISEILSFRFIDFLITWIQHFLPTDNPAKSHVQFHQGHTGSFQGSYGIYIGCEYFL